MGAVADFIKQFDQNDKMKKAAKEALDVAIKMVQTRFKTFEAQLNIGIGPVKKVPGEFLIASKKMIRA